MISATRDAISVGYGAMATDLSEAVKNALTIGGSLAQQDDALPVKDETDDLARPSMGEYKIYEEMRGTLDKVYHLKSQLDAAEKLRLAEFQNLDGGAKVNKKFVKLSDTFFVVGKRNDEPGDG